MLAWDASPVPAYPAQVPRLELDAKELLLEQLDDCHYRLGFVPQAVLRFDDVEYLVGMLVYVYDCLDHNIPLISNVYRVYITMFFMHKLFIHSRDATLEIIGVEHNAKKHRCRAAEHDLH